MNLPLKNFHLCCYITKILAALLYFFGLSLRKTSRYLSLFEVSHKPVRIYYHRLKKVLKRPRKRERRLSIDETKLKLEKKLIFVWAYRLDTKECLAIWASESRGSFEDYVFLKEVLKYCEKQARNSCR